MKRSFLLMLVGIIILGCTSLMAADTATITLTVTITQVLSVTVTPSSWAIGELSTGGSSNTSGGYFTATNDGNTAEDITISVGNSANWTAGTSPGSETFALQYSLNNGTTWTTVNPSGTLLVEGLAAGSSQSFDLKFLAPTSTAYGGIEQNISVTLSASASP